MNQNEFRALHHKLICEYKWKKKGNGRLVRINYGLVVMFSLWNCILIVNFQVKIARSWLLIETQIIHHHWVVVSVLIEHSFVHVQNNYIICSFIHSRPQHVAYNMFFFSRKYVKHSKQRAYGECKRKKHIQFMLN